MKYIIKFFSSFCDTENCKSVFERLCEFNYDNIEITNGDNYTHAIIINTAMPQLNIPKQNVVGLAFEPPEFLGLSENFIKYAQKYIGKYFIGTKGNLPNPFMEHYSYMWYCTPLKYIPEKTKLCSIIFSEKKYSYGHKYRYQIIDEIQKNNLPIDIYGRGCQFVNKKENIKGEFVEYEPYLDYKFHIVIENFQENDYISEKLINPLLCGCVPIYFGARNVDKYFDNIIKFDNIKLIIDIINNPNIYHRVYNINEIKNKVYLLKNLDKIFI